MAEYGEWNRKGATLSDVTALKEYGVSQEFMVKGIRAGRLEDREGSLAQGDCRHPHPTCRLRPHDRADWRHHTE